MKTEKAEKEIKLLQNDGLIFDYEFDYHVVNKFMFCIEKEGYTIKDIISKLQKDEKIIFLLNDGKTWNGKFGNDFEIFHNNDTTDSIYWEKENCGKWIRIDSDKGSIFKWANELEEKNKVKLN